MSLARLRKCGPLGAEARIQTVSRCSSLELVCRSGTDLTVDLKSGAVVRSHAGRNYSARSRCRSVTRQTAGSCLGAGVRSQAR